MTKRDYYKILNINKDATQSEIKSAYRKLAMQYHPDRNKNSDAEEKFKEINEAYEILSDKDKRSKYDQFGHAIFENNGNQGFQGFDGFDGFGDIFSSFFGGGFRRNTAPMKGNDYQAQISITFMQSVFGKTITEKLDKFVNGSKVKKEAEIKIPAGIKNGQSILVRDFGGLGQNGGPNGNLYININVQPHKKYIREGYDILITMPVSFVDIIQENQLEVPTPYGNKIIKLKKSYKSGTVLKISNQGFKAIRGDFNGDFKIHLEIYIPKFNFKEESKILEALKNVKNKNHIKWLKGFK